VIDPSGVAASGRARGDAGAPVVAGNLPAGLVPLIGRTDELDGIVRALESDRLVTLTGAPGIGKTRLALEVGSRRASGYTDGVWLVELAAIDEPDGVARAIAGTLRVWETTSDETLEAIVRYVADRTMLVVLDNCEHVVETCAHVVFGLLSGCPNLTVLATSREPLGVPGEVTRPVPPLHAPTPGTTYAANDVARFDAVQLFVDRARRATPGFAVVDGNAASVAAICARLDGIPLAIELAASRCRVMTPQQIAEDLDRRLVLPGRGARTVLARQQTLAASVSWSHDLLSDEERRVFRRLGVFSGAFPREAASIVGADDEHGEVDVVEVLYRLVDKSLLQLDADVGWYRLLETIRVYALERCADHGELDAIRDRHARWWLSWLQAHHPDAPTDDDLDAIHRGYPNLRAALLWAAGRDTQLAFELAGGLGIYWYLQGLLGDAIALGDLVLAGVPHDAAWSRCVGRLAATRHQANDTAFMSDVLTEASNLASRSDDPVTALRCRAAPIMTITNVDVFRELRDQAAAHDELWLTGRMQLAVTALSAILDLPDTDHEVDRLARMAEQLDATSFRFAARVFRAECLANDHDIRGAVAILEPAMADAARASPSTGIHAFWTLASYGLLLGEPETVERCGRLLRASSRDWGALTTAAVALTRLSDLLAGTEDWDRPLLTFPFPFAYGQVLWLLGDAIGYERLSLWTKADGLVRFARLLLDTALALAAGRFEDAEPIAAELVRRRKADRHFWLLVLARCAADTGDARAAARLLGAVSAVQDRHGIPWLPQLLLSVRDDAEQSARSQIGDDAYRVAFAEGASLELPDAVAYALRTRGERKRPATGWPSLTPTEVEVARHVADGRSNAEIAQALLMARTTVKTHLGHIFTKLAITNRAELAVIAAAHTPAAR